MTGCCAQITHVRPSNGGRKERGLVKFIRENLSRSAFVCLCLLTVLALSANLAVAQQVTAGIFGRVTDPSSASVANATVTAKDVDRGTTFTTTTNEDGAYSLPRVPIGTYELRAEVPGFQTQVTKLELQLNQNPRVDFQMKVGQVTETVEVTAAAPLLQTETTELGTVINSKTNVELPLATRNYVQLTLLAPGTVQPEPGSMKNGSGTNTNGGRPYVNGNREQANNFLLDGVDNNQVSDNLVGYTPSSRRHPGIQHDHEQRFGGVRQFPGRHHQRVDQVRHQRVPRQRLRVLPQ